MTQTFEQNLISKLGAEGFKKVQNTLVGIAGAGGLGSNCAANLVRSGFRRFVIVDFDKVSEANLDRQFYFRDQVGQDKTAALEENLKKINPGLDLKMIRAKIDINNIKEFFGDCDIVCECLDRAEAKAGFIGGLMTLNKFVVAVSGLGGVGDSDDIVVRRLKDDRLVMIGDMGSDIAQKPALSPRVNVAAAKQADVVLETVLKKIEKKT